MITLHLRLTLKSDATFGSGEGVAGVLDTEVQHDEYGLPFLSGRTLKGLIAGECANIMYALKEQKNKVKSFEEAAQHLFGQPGSTMGDEAIVHFGNVCFPEDLRLAIASEVDRKTLDPEQVLNAVTAIRRQTAIDETTGAPRSHSLRAIRVIQRETLFESELCFLQEPSEWDLTLLSACIKIFRRAGTGRNRGRGELIAQLFDERGTDVTNKLFEKFQKEVLG